jgi:hypothetical protein
MTCPCISVSASNAWRDFQPNTPAVASTAAANKQVTIKRVCVLIVTGASSSFNAQHFLDPPSAARNVIPEFSQPIDLCGALCASAVF